MLGRLRDALHHYRGSPFRSPKKRVSGSGFQPILRWFVSEMKTLGPKQVFTNYDNSRENAENELVIRTIKEEVIWPHEYEPIEEAREAVKKFLEAYNENHPHSALRYISPVGQRRDIIK